MTSISSQARIQQVKPRADGQGLFKQAKKTVCWKGDDDPKGGGLFLFRACRGLPKYGR